METNVYPYKNALPNKMVDENGNIKTLDGTSVSGSVPEYDNTPSLPNKFLNPDGTYSTLQEILANAVDTDLFEIVAKLPDIGNEKKIYLVPNGKGTFDEYHYHNGKWDPIGTLDISNLVTHDEMVNYVNQQIQLSITQLLGGEY